MRRIGPFTVPAIGLGCMNICHAYGAPPPADVAVRLLREAFDGVALAANVLRHRPAANASPLISRQGLPHRRTPAVSRRQACPHRECRWN